MSTNTTPALRDVAVWENQTPCPWVVCRVSRDGNEADLRRAGDPGYLPHTVTRGDDGLFRLGNGVVVTFATRRETAQAWAARRAVGKAGRLVRDATGTVSRAARAELVAAWCRAFVTADELAYGPCPPWQLGETLFAANGTATYPAGVLR